MEPNEYQSLAERTLVFDPDTDLTPDQFMLIWCALGLAGESGELVDYLKKGIMHKHGLDTTKVKDELGDILWYICGIATTIGIPLQDIMEHNIDKLKKRYPDGFSYDASKNRSNQ